MITKYADWCAWHGVDARQHDSLVLWVRAANRPGVSPGDLRSAASVAIDGHWPGERAALMAVLVAIGAFRPGGAR